MQITKHQVISDKHTTQSSSRSRSCGRLCNTSYYSEDTAVITETIYMHIQVYMQRPNREPCLVQELVDPFANWLVHFWNRKTIIVTLNLTTNIVVQFLNREAGSGTGQQNCPVPELVKSS